MRRNWTNILFRVVFRNRQRFNNIILTVVVSRLEPSSSSPPLGIFSHYLCLSFIQWQTWWWILLAVSSSFELMSWFHFCQTKHFSPSIWSLLMWEWVEFIKIHALLSERVNDWMNTVKLQRFKDCSCDNKPVDWFLVVDNLI